MTRRSLIRRLLLIFSVQPIVPWRGAGRQSLAAAQPAPRPAEPLTETLSASGLDDLVAFGEVVVGPGPLTPIERGFLVDHIQYRVPRASGYYLSLYRTTVGLLERLAGARFASLDVDQRNAVVTRYRLSSSRVWPDEDLGPFPEDARAVRTRVVGDLIGGYYGSPAGWAVVGYDAYPGRCSDLARYTGPGR
jgi:hypothetical protein